MTITDIGTGLGIAVFFSFFFYRSVWAFLPMLSVGGIFVYWGIQKKKRSRQLLYLEQFKECVLSVLGAVKAGYAVESAFVESSADMEVMYGRDCWIAKEVQIICRGIRNNKTLEGALAELGKRSQLTEISEFAEVFSIAKRNSGNIPETIELYSKVITDRLELIAELEKRTGRKVIGNKSASGTVILDELAEEEIKYVLSILKPKQIQNMSSNADAQSLQAFLPFLDEDDVAELAKEAKENGQQFTMYLPFMDDEVIAEWAREDRKNGRNIAMYLPFMDEDDVADMAKEALQQGRNITDYLPFMDEDDVKDLLMMVIQNKNK